MSEAGAAPVSPSSGRGPRRLRGLLLGVIFGLVGGGVLVLTAIAGALRHPPPPPVLGAVPDFAFEDQSGRPFRSADLDGKLWVVDFFFARCRGICPMLAERMHEVDRFAQARPELAARTGLLSITVDPANDNKDVLAAWAAAHHVDGTRWHLLTGGTAAVTEVVTSGFKMAIGAPTTDPRTGDLDILHGGHLVLVDDQRRIRGWFDSDPDGIRRLEEALSQLATEEHRP